MYKIEFSQLYKIVDKDKFFLDLIKHDSIDIEFRYLSNFLHTKILRDYIKSICSLMGLNSKNVMRIILIIDEMNNNAIEYGSKSGDLNKLRIKITKFDTYCDLNIEVEDSGKGIKPKSSLEMETLRAHRLKLGYYEHDSIRGRGLFLIIVKLVDRLYFKDSKNGGLIVGIIKKIKF